MLCLPQKEEVARMRRIVMLAVVALMMSLMMALAGPALAAHGGTHEEPVQKRCALVGVSIFFGGGPTPGGTIQECMGSI
jgi:hypothetical protein